MMSDSYSEAASLLIDNYRVFFGFIDRVLYGLLGLVYQLFFNVASSDIFANDTIMKFYSRVQLILGVFMLFQLAMLILRGIMNPDEFTKEGSGAGNLIKRIAIALFMLTALVPINIPSPQNEYEIQINNNGLLFGTLYSLQYRILENNTLGRLILGTNDSSDNYVSSNSSNSDSLETASRIFTSTILKTFFRINLLPEDARPDHCNDEDDPAIYNDCRMCQSGVDAYIDTYKQVDADPDDLISMVKETCGTPTVLGSIPLVNRLSGNKRYVFNYSPLISNIAAGIFIFIMLSFTIDIGVRAVKLAVLRLIAPIPIISYMDPKGSKDGAFNSWVKTLTSTYLDLFVRLALVYFVLFIIQKMMIDGISVGGTGPVKWFSYVIIAISLFIFAKQAPKFLKKAIGLKDTDFKLFGGIGEALAIGSTASGVASGAISGAVSKYQNTSGNSGKRILMSMFGGIGGAVGGGYNAGKTYFGSKDANAKSIMNANRAYASKNYSNAEDKSTFGGRLLAGAQANLGLKNDLQLMDEKIKYFNAAKDAMGRMNDAFSSNGDCKIQYRGNTIKDSNGHTILEQNKDYSLKDYKDKLNRVQASGDDALIEAVDSAMKTAQGERLAHLRSTFKGKNRDEARASLEAKIKECAANGSNEYTQRDLDVFDGAYTIYNVASKYSNESFFSGFKGKKFEDVDTDPDKAAKEWGGLFKKAASTAGDTAKSIQASTEYDRAKANAQRAEESKKK